jgi:hypothetical protein
VSLNRLQAQGRQRNENGEFYVFRNNNKADAVGDVYRGRLGGTCTTLCRLVHICIHKLRARGEAGAPFLNNLEQGAKLARL